MDGFDLLRAWRFDPETTRLALDTIRAWGYYVAATFGFSGLRPQTCTPGEIHEHLEGIRGGAARRGTHAALKHFFRFCVREGHRTDNPLDIVARRPGRRRRVRQALDPDELLRLVIAAAWGCDRRPWSGIRLAKEIVFLYLTGLRPSEYLRLERDRIHLNGSTSEIEVVATKTDNDRRVPLCAAARELLYDLVADQDQPGRGISRDWLWEQVHRAAVRAGLPERKRKPYILRHTFATHLLERGVHRRVVQELMGNVDDRALQGYTIPADDELRRAVEILG